MQLSATHIVGGEIYYDNLGNNNYKITLKVYKDCTPNIPGQLPTHAIINIFDISGTLVDTMLIPMFSLTNIAPSINNPCITPPGSACVEEGLYIETINLPPKIGGYNVVFQSCCRNGTILNIINPGQTGVTYSEHIPGPEVVATNSCPRFNKFPPMYLCNGVQIKFDHMATDPDGDVLVYSLCDPYDGCSPPPTTGVCPVVPPPYSPINFITPYSGTFPMSANPALNINSSTGYLNGTPDIDGQWVVGVCVQEWRGTQLIGTHYRDFQFNVVTCIVSVLAQFNNQSSPITINGNPVSNQFCNGYTLYFNNNSIGGTTFLWDFGDLTTLADTSNLPNTSYTYPDTGTYVVSLIANPGKPCVDTIKKIFYVYPDLKPTFVAPPPQCITGNSFNFNVGGIFSSYSTFNWNFGTSASIITSTVQSPTGVSYNAAGNFPVNLVVTQKMCVKTLTGTVMVYPKTKAEFDADSVSGCDPVVVTFTNNSIAGGTPSYLWQFGNGGSSTLANPTHTFTPAGVYGVTLTIISTAGCIDTSKFIVPGIVTAHARPQAAFSFSPTETTILDPDIIFSDGSSNAVSWYYDFGDGDGSSVPSPIHTYLKPDEFIVIQTVVNGFGCQDTATRIVRILPEYRFWVPNAFTPKNKDGMNDIFLPIVFGVEEYVFEIYDRWGERIFRTQDTQKGWDGNRLGSPCKSDVYVWMITFFNLVTEREEVHYGSVTLWK